MVDSYNDVLGWIGDETTRLFDIAIDNAPVSGGIFVEIGTYRGKSTICLYDKIKNSNKEITLFTCDDWSFKLPHDLPEEDNKQIFLDNIGTRDIKVLDHSYVDVTNFFTTESIDFLFIDNNSQGPGLTFMLENWFPKVKNNGIISGHDYHWDDIRSVVDSFFHSASILEETETRTREFDFQPETYKLTSWHYKKG